MAEKGKADIRERLRRLGVHKGAGHLARTRTRVDVEPLPVHTPTPPLHESPTPASALSTAPFDPHAPLWNLQLPTVAGDAYVRRTCYPPDHRHGAWSLAQALQHPPQLLTRLGGNAPVELRNALFLDTETTGLAGGAGTLVFLVGIGYFVGDSSVDGVPPGSFVVDQFFLPDPVEEAAMLCALDERVNQSGALVTFNGRGFDVPLLETRFTLARMAPSFADHAHLDLLMPARRAWRVELASCSLSSLEFHMLDVRREQQDIPGFLIPQLYREYLATHDPAEMQRVMYHNLHDILSMVSLVSRLCSAISAPRNAGEYLAAGLYEESAGRPDDALAVYRTALTAISSPGSPLYRRIVYRMACCLKQQERRADAAPYWQQLAEGGDLDAWVELAKHYEWHDVDLQQALVCATRALALSRDALTRTEINHRIARLQRKLR
jgi:uncharacterized protein YprB with RNaseH-like and TPR domain